MNAGAAVVALAMLLGWAGVAVARADTPTESQPVQSNATSEVPEPEPAELADLTARGHFNSGLAMLDAGDFDDAVQAFLRARDHAGIDPELRYRAAFNLGYALASSVRNEAEGGEDPEAMQEAVATLRQSSAWFGDAVRLAPEGDEDARINLELVSRRILALADNLRDKDRLEARLERLIDDQRSVRDGIRGLLTEIAAQEAATEPLGFRVAHDDLATHERTLMADVADSADLAADERLFVEQTPEEERTPDQRLRIWQLTALGEFLQSARQSLGDARLRLRRLEGESAHRFADAALAQLKRAREQVLDPVTVLQAVARDEAELILHTDALSDFDQGALDLDEPPPPWLTAGHLAERQEDAEARAAFALAYLEAATRQEDAEGDVAAANGGADAASEASPESERLLQAATRAVPALANAVENMGAAAESLRDSEPAGALGAQRTALEGLHQAIEEFAGLRQLIELALDGQERIVELVSGGEGSEDAQPAAGREETVLALAAGNARRLANLEPLIEGEREAAILRAGAESVAEDEDQDQAATEEHFAHAESLRESAAREISALEQLIGSGVADGTEFGQAAETALASLKELRQLFFTVVEHLDALRAEQLDTHDRTATLQFENASKHEPRAGERAILAARQRGHERHADALAAALAGQADAVPPDAGTGSRLAEASEEVRKAGLEMRGAAERLADETVSAAVSDLEPALTDQMAAVEYLEAAIQLLAQPEAGDEPGGQPQEGAEESREAQQAQAEEDQPLSRRQALQRLQAIRDREAERRRNRQRQAGSASRNPVETDW